MNEKDNKNICKYLLIVAAKVEREIRKRLPFCTKQVKFHHLEFCLIQELSFVFINLKSYLCCVLF